MDDEDNGDDGVDLSDGGIELENEHGPYFIDAPNLIYS
jgi:hypothetical protein